MGRLSHLDPNDKPVLIYATYPDAETAEAGGRTLVEAGLVACVNILPEMISVYRWDGMVERATECVAIFKTRSGLAERVIHAARERHPYTTPAFVVLPVEGGLTAYLDWIAASTRPD
jgi:periplasmic divalent cation tolerance protein